MPSLRKASSYSKKKVRPYTRNAKSRKKAYIKTIPGVKIVKYQTGDQTAYRQGKHPFEVSFVSKETVQIRDNSLEACRTLITKNLEKRIPGQYFFNIRVHPHHMLRENKTAAGAGADRLSSGMKHSFGTVVGRAALVRPGKTIFFVSCSSEQAARSVREVLKMVKPKVPCKGRVVFEKVE